MLSAPGVSVLVSISLLLAACAAGPQRVQTAAAVQPRPPTGAIRLSVGASSTGNYLAGRFAIKRHDFGAAAGYLSQALRFEPENRNLLRRAFMVTLAGGRMDWAVKLARRIVKLDTNAPLANLALVVGDLTANEPATAERRLEKMSRRGLNAFMLPLLKAWVIAGQGRADDAFEALKPLGDISGFAILYDLHAGLLNDFLGNSARAEESYKRAANRTTRSTLRVVEALGSYYERSGRPQKAREIYSGYLKENPDSLVLGPALARLESGTLPPPMIQTATDGAAEAFFNVAGNLTQENSAQMALVYGRLAIELRPDFPIAQMLVGRVLESLGRPADAVRAYDEVSSLSPLHWSARLRKASSLELLGNDEEAMDQLRTMSSEQVSRSDALINLGDILRSKKRFAESVDAYDAAISRIGQVDKRHWAVLYSRGISLERSKQWARAETDFLTALKLNPDQPYVLNYLGYSWVDQGINMDRARRMIERAVELRPNDGYIIDSLGWVLYRLGEFEGAARRLERAVELRPQDPTINDHLGDSYWQVGRRLEARFQWRRALTLNPEPEQDAAIRRKIASGLDNSQALNTNSN